MMVPSGRTASTSVPAPVAQPGVNKAQSDPSGRGKQAGSDRGLAAEGGGEGCTAGYEGYVPAAARGTSGAISRFCSIPWPVRPGSDKPRSCVMALCTSTAAVLSRSVREASATVLTRSPLRPGAPLFGPGSVAFCRAVPKTSLPHFSPLHQKKGNQSKTSTSDRLPLPPGPSDFPGPARPSYFAARYHPSPPQSLVPFSLSRLVSSRLCPVPSPTSFPFQFPQDCTGSTASGPWTKPPDPRSSRLCSIAVGVAGHHAPATPSPLTSAVVRLPTVRAVTRGG